MRDKMVYMSALITGWERLGSKINDSQDLIRVRTDAKARGECQARIERIHLVICVYLVPLILEKEMATHSSVLAWRLPGTGEPGGLPSLGLHRVRHD